MARGWRFFRGEVRTLGQSFEDELADGDSLTGTVTVEVREQTGTGEDDWTDRDADFTVANAQVMASDTEGEDGKTIPAGEGILFQLTAADDPGDYTVRMEVASDGGEDPLVIERPLKVTGSPATIA